MMVIESMKVQSVHSACQRKGAIKDSSEHESLRVHNVVMIERQAQIYLASDVRLFKSHIEKYYDRPHKEYMKIKQAEYKK